jgi:hypothetical protein
MFVEEMACSRNNAIIKMDTALMRKLGHKL